MPTIEQQLAEGLAIEQILDQVGFRKREQERASQAEIDQYNSARRAILTANPGITDQLLNQEALRLVNVGKLEQAQAQLDASIDAGIAAKAAAHAQRLERQAAYAEHLKATQPRGFTKADGTPYGPGERSPGQDVFMPDTK